MKFLQLFPSYGEYVEDFYARHPGVAARPYQEQNALLRDDGFGIVHMFARYLGPLGYEPEIVFTECEPTQRKWLEEQGGVLANPDNWRHEIAARQVNAARPDVLIAISPPATEQSSPLRVQLRTYERDLPHVKHLATFGLLWQRREARRGAARRRRPG